MQHAYPLDEIDEPPEPTREEVAAKVEDWLDRLAALLADLRTWALDHGWTVEDEEPIEMLEEPMRRAGLPPASMPRLMLHAPNGGKVWVWPKALWVYGANGRVDLFSTKGAYTLIDRARPEGPPAWVLDRLGRGTLEPFNVEALADMI